MSNRKNTKKRILSFLNLKIMRAVNYFIKRFEYAAKGNGTIKLNQNDVDALNQIIEFYNTGYKNTELEDALLLFYILQNWKVENKNNQAIALLENNKDGNIMKLTSSIQLLKKICVSLRPKNSMYKEIANELWASQALNKVPKEKWITELEIKELLDEELKVAKNEFSFAKDLNKGKVNFLNEDLSVFKFKKNRILSEKLKSISEKLNYSDSEEIYQTLCKELL